MQQLDFTFFWPLTEQVPLDLDYTECEKPKLYTNLLTSGSGYIISNGGTTSNYITASNLTIDVASTTFKLTEKPNIIRRGLLNILGVKWEKK
jgi:hypothetical protein